MNKEQYATLRGEILGLYILIFTTFVLDLVIV